MNDTITTNAETRIHELLSQAVADNGDRTTEEVFTVLIREPIRNGEFTAEQAWDMFFGESGHEYER